MAKILLADTETNDTFTQKLLQGKHELVVVSAISKAAVALKSQAFDLIIVDLNFDESRMFEAMQLVKASTKNSDKPIICIATANDKIQRPFIDSVDFTTRAMGAWMFLDTHEYRQKQDPESELLRIIERCLAGDARKAASKGRSALHERRVEIHRLRSAIENEEWSDDFEDRLVELRQKLTALLVDVCDLNIDTIALQEGVDESRVQKDHVSESVVDSEDNATRVERKQTLDELHLAVDEFAIAGREDEAKKIRENQTKAQS